MSREAAIALLSSTRLRVNKAWRAYYHRRDKRGAYEHQAEAVALLAQAAAEAPPTDPDTITLIGWAGRGLAEGMALYVIPPSWERKSQARYIATSVVSKIDAVVAELEVG